MSQNTGIQNEILLFDGTVIPTNKRQLIIIKGEKKDCEDQRVYANILNKSFKVIPEASDLSDLKTGGPNDQTWPEYQRNEINRFENVFLKIGIWDELEGIECEHNNCLIYEIPGTELVILSSDNDTMLALKDLGIYFHDYS